MMKKIVLSIFAVIIMAFCFLTFHLNIAQASRSYVDKFDSDVYVQKDGSARIDQTIRFYVHGTQKQFNFTQHFSDGVKTNDAKPQVTFYDGKNELPLHYGSSDDNTYTSVFGNGLVGVNVYHTISDNFATAKYSYRVKNFVTNYQDIGDINWRLIGPDWKMSFKKVKLTYHLPADAKDEIHGYEKGPTNYQIKLDQKNNSATFLINNVSANQLLDTRIIFPSSVTPDNPNTVNEKAKARIMRQEAKYTKNQQIKRTVFYIIGIIFALIIVVLYFILFRSIYQNPYNKDYPMDKYLTWFKIPEFSPTMTKLLLNRRPLADFSCFIGELLVLVDQGNLKLYSTDTGVQLERVGPIRDDLVAFLIDRIGNGQQVSTIEIQRYHQDDLYREFHNWIIKSSNSQYRFIEPISQRYGRSFANIALITSFLAITQLILAAFLNPAFVYATAYFSISILLLSWLIFWLFTRHLKCLSESGKDIVAELTSFNKVLSDSGKFEKAVENRNITKSAALPYVITLQKSSIIDLDLYDTDREVLATLVAAFQKNRLFIKHHVNI